MSEIEQQKVRLEQKKNRLIAEETRLKLKERKMRTRKLIELGGLIAKARLDHIDTNTLYGALLSLADAAKQNDNMIRVWTEAGKHALEQEQALFTAVIVKFSEQPNESVRKKIRLIGLRWNSFRGEWYGNISNLDELKSTIEGFEHDLEVIKQ